MLKGRKKNAALRTGLFGLCESSCTSNQSSLTGSSALGAILVVDLLLVLKSSSSAAPYFTHQSPLSVGDVGISSLIHLILILNHVTVGG